ncbi:hypothetical protein SELMODRAFT_423101 [Selaginella moellendorffii]|uniref:Uncharacterized protein n=1 Tax=Selaginella moellendorffii TaxID=88036 RepID=D8SKK4_SELML|nr:hypothetical protein SELMODRAFT_423101 [Selaginella moellendorffii]
MNRQTASEYLHQRGRVYQVPCRKNGMKMVTTDILRRELLPVLPLAGMVLLAIGLGVWTFWWEHVAHPNVSITRDLRERLFEIEHPEWVKRKAAVYLQSPLRKMSLEWPTARIAHIQQELPPPIAHGGPLS